METNFKNLELYACSENEWRDLDEKEAMEIDGGGYWIMTDGKIVWVEE